MNRIAIALTSVLLSFSSLLAATLETGGTLKKAIVYRGQALVTRVIDINFPQGPGEIIITGLPDKIKPESLYAQAPSSIIIHNVRYREQSVDQQARPEIKQIDTQIAKLTADIRHLENDRNLLTEYVASLNKLENFSTSAASSDLSRGLLQFEPLKSLTDYVQSRRGEYAKNIFEFDDKLIDAKKQLEFLNRRRSEYASSQPPKLRQAVIALNVSDPSPSSIELNYLVDDASWFPQYNLRADTAAQAVQIEYNAVLHQASGEDWSGISLSLSTAQPSMVASAPSLEPMLISVYSKTEFDKKDRNVRLNCKSLAVPEVGREAEFIDITEQYRTLAKRKLEDASKGLYANAALNSISLDNQMLMLTADSDTAARLQREESKIARTEGLSVTYAVPGTIILPSRTDQQLVTIASTSARADFIHVATPILTDYVYLQADIRNSGPAILLAGSASVFRDGQFAGTASVPMVTIGETFKAGFGIDSQVQLKRELDSKTSDTGWVSSRRTDSFTYRLAAENFKSVPVKLRLLDRLPYSEDEKIKIDLKSVSKPLSTDADYLRADRKKGILRWDMTLNPASPGQSKTVLSYTYTLEYDKEMTICKK